MIPNIDPKTLKNMMAKMGIKSNEVSALSVTIHCTDRDIVIESPQVMQVEMQGNVSFQISGRVSEKPKSPEQSIEISEDDVKLVADRTGASSEAARKALADANGDIAAAIVDLTGNYSFQ